MSKKEVEIMKETVMLNILDKLEWLIVRNRTFEAKRRLKIELENLRGITEQQCKLTKVRKDYCNFCWNYNCNNYHK